MPVKKKSSTAFRTIGEVAAELGVAQHVLRFWENKFPQIKPHKRRGGHRYYRPIDVEILKEVKSLLHDQGYTIKGAQKYLQDISQQTEKIQPTMFPDNTDTSVRSAASKQSEKMDTEYLEKVLNELYKVRNLLAHGI